jgi:hypothetical protein
MQAPINEAKNKCEVEYTPFLSLLCSWCLDEVLAGQLEARCFSYPQRKDQFWGPPRLLSSESWELFLEGLKPLQIIIIFI